VREREGLVDRIRNLRRAAAAADARPSAEPSAENPSFNPTRLEHLEARLEHLEQLLEGFQDSVHRESQRTTKRLGDLEARLQPAALGAALDKDARERGL
jgi:hypothetical protein